MKSLWDTTIATQFSESLLQLRVYTSRLIGREPELVLHGGGNTSVKTTATNIFGETADILYIKGSGWNLASIDAEGFPAVKLHLLQRLAELEHLSDMDMVRSIRSGMTDPGAPTPSVEAILHAIIPFSFVDHTHADAVVTITNTPNGADRIREVYGESMVIVPYVMPGFILAKTVYEMTKNSNWGLYEGIILLNHGIFTFANDAKSSYERMIDNVTKAERYLKNATKIFFSKQASLQEDLKKLTYIRGSVSRCKESPTIAKLNCSTESIHFSSLPNLNSIATRGPLTPDHVIRTKRIPLIIHGDPEEDITRFAHEYREYFDRHGNETLKCLDPAPCWAIWPGHGVIAFGGSLKEAEVVAEITDHTIRAIELADMLGGWNPLPEKDIFDVEYWELEQAKLNRRGGPALFHGKIALVTGAASGIGRACVEKLYQGGAVVVALDIRPEINDLFEQPDIRGIHCDVRDSHEIDRHVKMTVRNFGGLDILVCNAGIFPESERIAELNENNWNQSLDINVTSHQRLLKTCIPYLSLGIDSAVIIIGSKNVPAPGPGAAAYSVAKAGLTQLGRVAALELGSFGIRVNIVHPNAVFDTGIWTDELIADRARHYEMDVNSYKTNNLLRVEITSKDVAELVCALAGPAFAKITGAQIPIDGGNDRVL